MILKKPYVILIKYFRIIHLILSIFIIYSIYKINGFLTFFNNYLSTQNSVVGQNLQSNLFDSLIFVFTFLIFVVSIILLWLMVKKKKPFRFYLCNTFIFIFSFGVLVYTYSFLGKMSSTVVDVVNVRVLRDLFIIILFLQSVALLITFIRTIGFDIKSFEFMKDLQQLELSEEDQEEYEVDFSFDSNESRRKRRRKLRYLKYSFKENKLFIYIVLLILIIFVGIYIYNNFGIYTRLNKEGVSLSTSYYNFGVDNTYLVNTSYSGIKITDNYLVVVNLKIKNNGLTNKIITSNFKLQIGNNNYLITNKYDKYLTDLGNVYNNELLSDNYNNYLFVFEVPISDIKKDMKLIYYEDSKSLKIKLNPIIYNKDVKEYVLGDTIDIDDNDSVTINNYEIQESFLLNYDFCIKDNCYNSKQYIVPTLNKNYDKVILKLSASFTRENESNYNNFNDLLLGIGTIQYTKGDITNISNFESISNIKKIENDIYYYEIDKNVLGADSIKIVFNTRKCKYLLILK